MKKKIGFTLIVVVLLGCVWFPVAAQDSADLTMQVQTGYDGYCHSTAWCPVRVILANEGADIEGRLVVPAGSGGTGERSDVYARSVMLPTRSHMAYTLLFPPGGITGNSKIRVALRSGTREIASREVSIAWLDSDERLYGVIGSDASAFGFLANVAPLGGDARVAYLDVESLPSDPLAWEGLDVLLLNDVDTTALDGAQRQALETWIAHGGHLIVGGGAGAARTAAGLADLLPVSVGGTRTVDSLWALDEPAGASSGGGPFAVAEIALREGGAALLEQDDLVLLARRTHGAGRVSFIAFDAGLNVFQDWSDTVELWGWFVGADAGAANRFSIQSGYSARDAASSIPGRGLPQPLHIAGFLLVYVILIGPINYVILRKLDRRELAWLTVPLLIVGFSACAYVTGFQLRGAQAIVNRLALVHVPQGAESGRAYQLMGLFSPRRTRYDVRLPDAQVQSVPGDYTYGGSVGPSLELWQDSAGVTVKDLRVDVGGVEPFVAEGYVDVPPLESNLRVVEGAGGDLWLEGTLRTGGQALEDALVIVGQETQYLGELAADRDVAVSVRLGAAVGSTYMPDLPDRIIHPAGSYWEDAALYRRYSFLQALFGSFYYPSSTPTGGRTSTLATGAYLIGWVEDEAPLPVEVLGRSHSAKDTTLYVYGLSLAESAVTVIPSSLVRREVVETVGTVYSQPGGFHMESESEITFRFTWSVANLQQVDELVFDVRRNYSPGLPAISLWNHQTDEWDQFNWGWGSNWLSETDPYVSSSDSVLLRIESGDNSSIELSEVSLTVRGK